MEYYIGQIFDEMYPPEAAEWCNNNNAVIDEIEPQIDTELEIEVRRFKIQEKPEPTPPTPEEIKKQRIAELKTELNSTDYKIIKCSEYQLAGIDLPYDVAELHTQRQTLRDEINELENE